MQESSFALRDIRGFHVGGEIVRLEGQPRRMVRVSPDAAPRPVDLNGHYVSGQLYAQHFMLESPRAGFPVLFWHGGAMTGVTWETTPDDRPGWATEFLRAGYDVVVSDAVERGRASWSPYPQIYDGAPLFRTQEDAWGLFRIGRPDGFSADPARRRALEPQRFPTAEFDRFCAQFVPRWTTNAGITTDAYVALVSSFEKVVIVAHSQGGWFAQRVAARLPSRIAAIVIVEPPGAPNLTDEERAAAARVPHLYVWGDHIDDHAAWSGYKADAMAHSERLTALGGRIEHLDLPARGIRGNSHMPMMDDNSAEVGAMVRDWIDGLGEG